ncbi:nickel-dependent lactate racemase [bacterium]|nr:nickel-dependent lactate racemase [bacterium]
MEEIIKLPYGDIEKEFNLRGLKVLGVLKPQKYPEIVEQKDAIYKAIKTPEYGSSLIDIAKGKRSAVILVSDKTRRTLAKEVVPILLEELTKGGIPLSSIAIIVAVGAHPMLTEEEIEHLLGRDVTKAVTVINHNCRDESSLEYRGVSSKGTPIYINKIYLESELKILTGAVNYHDFAGFSGGAKSILPGISGFSTISHNHLMLLNPSFGTGYNPMATAGILEGNPVHEDMEEIAELVGIDFIINTVFNAEGKLSRIVSGTSWKQAHRAGCKAIEEIFSVEIKGKADIVLVSAGGYPFDINFYQVMKSVINTMKMIKEDGAIILVASCKEGLGTEDLREWLSIESPTKLEKELRNNFNMIGKIAYDIRVGIGKRKVIMITDLPEEEVKLLGFQKADTLEEIKEILSIRNDPTLYIVPYGNITIARSS